MFLCPPCATKLVVLNKIPTNYISKSAKPIQVAEGSQDVLANFFPANLSMSPTQDDQDKEDDLDCSIESIESLPCGQGSPKKSTQEIEDLEKEEDKEEDENKDEEKKNEQEIILIPDNVSKKVMMDSHYPKLSLRS